MTTKLVPIPIIYYQLQPLKPLYMVTGPLGTQIFACKKSSAIPQLLPQLLSLFGCPNAYDNKVWSHTHHSLPIAANETPLCGHKKLRNTSFQMRQHLQDQVCPRLSFVKKITKYLNILNFYILKGYVCLIVSQIFLYILNIMGLN